MSSHRERADRVRPQSPTLDIRAQEEVDAGVAEVRLELLDCLDVPDDLAFVDDHEGVLLGIALDEVGDHPVEVEDAPPSGHRRFGEDPGEQRGVVERRRPQCDVPTVQLHGARVAPPNAGVGVRP
jgi:hypothetical protein